MHADQHYNSSAPGKQGKIQNIKSNQNLNSASSLNLENGAQQNLNVIFHPHPLNNNMAPQTITNGMELNSLGSQRAHMTQVPTEQVTIDSARPMSNKPLQMNNRNSRKNLRPLGNKKQQTGQAYSQ